MGVSAALSSRAIPGLKHISSSHKPNNARPLIIQCMATKKPNSSSTPPKTTTSKKAAPAIAKPAPRNNTQSGTQPVKLLTRVEQLRLLTKAEKAGLLSAAENFGLSLATIEKLGLLSKAEELGLLSTATNPETPSTLLSLSLVLLLVGPAFVLLVPEDYIWEVAVQVLVALACIVGGSATFAASNLVSNLQKLK